MLPLGAFAAILAFLGFDLLDTWLRVERRRLPRRDFAIVLVILATAATVGFLTALAVGLLVAGVLFVIAYSRVDVVRLRTSAALLRSRVERPDPELRPPRRPRRPGRGLPALGLSLLRHRQPVSRRDPPRSGGAGQGPRFDVLDFRRVSGIDASAAFALGKLWRSSAASGIELILCDASPALRADLASAGLPPTAADRGSSIISTRRCATSRTACSPTRRPRIRAPEA